MLSPNDSPAGAEQRQPRATERRTAPRRPCLRQCLVWPQQATGDGQWSGVVYNLSTTGIGLALPCPVRPGTVLVIEPWNQNNAGRACARVVRSTPHAFVWFHGCELVTALSDEDLEAWLRPSAAPRTRPALP